MSQENSRFASMLNVNGTTYAYYPVSAVAGSEQLPYSLTVLLENVLRNAETPEAAEELAALCEKLGAFYKPEQIGIDPALSEDMLSVSAAIRNRLTLIRMRRVLDFSE